MYRVLRPGGRFVVADAFLKTTEMNAFARACYRAVCSCWSLDQWGEIGQFTSCAMQRYRNIAGSSAPASRNR